MIEKWLNKLVLTLISSGVAEQEKKEIIVYGLYVMLLKLTQMVVLTVISIPLRIFWQTMAYTLFYLTLRKYAGGTHMRSPASCIIGFTLIAVAASLVSVSISEITHIFMIPAYLISALLVFTQAPVTHKNDWKSERSKKILKRKSRLLVLWQIVILEGIFLFHVIPDSLILSCTFGLVSAALTLLTNERG